MILIDLNQVCIANILQEIKQIKKIEPLLVKHMILSTLLFYRRKFSPEYGELVICCDSKHSWRKDIFPFYKANRKTNRQKDDIDWSGIFEVINSPIAQEMKSEPKRSLIVILATLGGFILSILYILISFLFRKVYKNI